MNFLSLFTGKIPVSYNGIINKVLDSFYEGKKLTMLDIGSNNGQLISMLNKDGHFVVTGIELSPQNAKVAMKTGYYANVIVGDIMKYKFDHKFDIIFCSHLIEHLSKENGIKLLQKVERINKEGMIFITPKGFQRQSKRKVKENAFEEHVSGWEPYEFEQLGYKVNCVSSKAIFYFRDFLEKHMFLGLVASTLSVIQQPITSKFSSLALYMICYKRNEK